MLGFKINEAKSMFFDRPAVIASVGKATVAALAKGGGLIRTIARRSMKRAPKKPKTQEELQSALNRTSNPKKAARIALQLQRMNSTTDKGPPHTIMGLLKQFLYFAWDPSNRAEVIGPAKLDTASDNVPLILEEGGTETVKRKSGTVRIKIAPHPYMGPALEEARPQLPAFWANSVKP